MLIPFDKNLTVEVANPKAKEFQMCRTNLLPGILKTLDANIKYGLPQRLFETGDVVLRDRRFSVGARNERRICCLICTSQDNAFEEIHGVLDRIMELNQFKFSAPGKRLNALE